MRVGLVVCAIAAVATCVAFASSPSVSRAAVGTCSKATALQVAEPLFIWGTDVSTPIAQVLCGAFTGSGSNAMAVTFTAPTCWPRQGWAVFRFTGRSWHLVLKQPGVFLAAPLGAVGGGIKETRPIFRTGDGRCFQSGGTHARVWRWNGLRFAPGRWTQAAAAGPLHITYFQSLSGNIICGPGDEDLLYCQTRTPPQSLVMAMDGTLHMCTGSSRCAATCSRYAGCRPDSPVLAYGDVTEWGAYRCSSAKDGVTCVIARGASAGRGFLIAKDGITKVAP